MLTASPSPGNPESADESERPASVIIACEVMKAELEAAAQSKDVQIYFLDQGLHRTPQKMTGLIQEKIDHVSQSVERVGLAYGLCSGGIKGLTGNKHVLAVPRCHDCIALFLGSPEAYREAFRSRPGTYYLTSGWIGAQKDPLGVIYDDYAPKHGIETAVWVMEEELKHYTHIALIDTGIGELKFLRARTRENCLFLRKEYLEIKGSLDYFRKLIHGPYNEDEFLIIPPGGEVTEEMFLGS